MACLLPTLIPIFDVLFPVFAYRHALSLTASEFREANQCPASALSSKYSQDEVHRHQFNKKQWLARGPGQGIHLSYSQVLGPRSYCNAAAMPGRHAAPGQGKTDTERVTPGKRRGPHGRPLRGDPCWSLGQGMERRVGRSAPVPPPLLSFLWVGRSEPLDAGYSGSLSF
jgi:hypothetical protein